MSISPAVCDQVYALPITGEAFLLRRRGYSVLVDGGWRKDNVARVLAICLPAVKTLDVVVCTHGDGDHAGGLPDLLKRWPGRIGQVWLPGRWVEVVPDLMKNPRGFICDLIRELDTIIRESSSAPVDESPFEYSDGSREYPAGVKLEWDASGPHDSEGLLNAESFADGGWDDLEINLGTTEPTDEPAWFAELRAAGNLATETVAASAFQAGRSRIRYRKSKRRISEAGAKAWLGMIDTVEAIRGIAATAIARRLRIRWFDYHSFATTRRPSGGIGGFLEPINAREQAPALLPRLTILMKLTVINRHSLVFFAPPRWSRLGVLFCGDSPLGDSTQSFLKNTAPPILPIVATAPHHGAETNRAAYDHMRSWGCVVVLLRAGGGRNQPGTTFKGLDWPIKLCATCPKSGRSPQITGVVDLERRPWFPSFVLLGTPCGCT